MKNWVVTLGATEFGLRYPRADTLDRVIRRGIAIHVLRTRVLRKSAYLQAFIDGKGSVLRLLVREQLNSPTEVEKCDEPDGASRKIGGIRTELRIPACAAHGRSPKLSLRVDHALAVHSKI